MVDLQLLLRICWGSIQQSPWPGCPSETLSAVAASKQHNTHVTTPAALSISPHCSSHMHEELAHTSHTCTLNMILQTVYPQQYLQSPNPIPHPLFIPTEANIQLLNKSTRLHRSTSAGEGHKNINIIITTIITPIKSYTLWTFMSSQHYTLSTLTCQIFLKDKYSIYINMYNKCIYHLW